MATANAAQATADYNARATSTAAFRSTADAISFRATEQALNHMATAQADDTTATADIRTAQARSTAMAATPTAQAVKTAQAIQSVERARSESEARQWFEFWRTLRLIIIALAIVLAIVGVALAAFRGCAAIEAERLRQRANIAQTAIRLLGPGNWAEWQAQDGWRVYPLPGQLDAPPMIIENHPTSTDYRHDWRIAYRQFCFLGYRYGFGVRDLSGPGYVSDDGWRTLTDDLKRLGVLADGVITGKRGRGTTWASGWSLDRLDRDIWRLIPPTPSAPPPKVDVLGAPQHHNTTTNHNTTSREEA